MTLLDQPLTGAEFLAVDTETNGLGGDACEVTEIGTVLVGGGELHDRWASLVAVNIPLRRGIQRFTGITQSMVDGAPSSDAVLPELIARLDGRVMVAHNAPFDRRVLRQACERIGLEWPDPPVICTAALARAMMPLQRERKLGRLADALGIEVELAHRALADAETCGRVLCALLPRLCAHAGTIEEAIALLQPRRRRRRAAAPRDARPLGRGAAGARARGRDPVGELDFARLPRDPGVYLFRDAAGQTLYVGKSLSIRNRARAHFAPSAPRAAWREHATIVDYRATASELGALVLENRLIKELRPPGNTRLNRLADDRLVYIRCRLDIPYPILEVAREPAAGHGVTIGPLRGRRLVDELVEQLESLFGLRHCGRTLPRRTHPSAYGQMGRCLSPCLGDLDPNLYRRRLDGALAAFLQPDGTAAAKLIAHVETQMHAAAAERRYERAGGLRRRARRLRVIFERLEGVALASHVQPRLVSAPHPAGTGGDLFWLVGGRLVDWGPWPSTPEQLVSRTERALRHASRAGDTGAHVPPGEIDEVRLIGTYLLTHPDLPQLPLPAPDAALVALAGPDSSAQVNGSSVTVARTAA